jgi:hypothetical protein
MFTLTLLICMAGSDMPHCTPETARLSIGQRCETIADCKRIGSYIAADYPMRPGEFVKFVVEQR